MVRPIKNIQFGFAYFVLILSASKYFRQISLSFYICRGENDTYQLGFCNFAFDWRPNISDFHVGKSSENICTLEELKQLCAIFKDFLMKIRRQLFKVDHFQHCHSALMGIVRFVTFVHMDLFTDKYFCSQKEKST